MRQPCLKSWGNRCLFSNLHREVVSLGRCLILKKKHRLGRKYLYFRVLVGFAMIFAKVRVATICRYWRKVLPLHSHLERFLSSVG